METTARCGWARPNSQHRKGSVGSSGICEPISRGQNHQDIKVPHFWAQELGPQVSCWYTSWKSLGLSHISASNSGPRPTPTCQVVEIFGPSCLSIFPAPAILPQPRPFPPKPRDAHRPAALAGLGIDRVSGRGEVGYSLLSQEGSQGRPPRPAELCA